jgi:hypothetical protein
MIITPTYSLNLQDVYQILNRSEAVIVEREFLSRIYLSPLTGDSTTAFLVVMGHGSDGEEYCFEFTEEDNQVCRVEGTGVVLRATSGAEVELVPLCMAL